MKSLQGKVALVTGGGRDIGRYTSMKLAEAGASVCINYFDGEELANETLQMVTDAGGKAILAQGDMTKTADVKKVVAECTEAFGEDIHILVNVAGGLMGRKTMEELDEKKTV